MHEIIDTDRTTLRPLQASDTTDFARLVNNRKICRMTGSFPFPFDAPSVAGKVDIFLARAACGTAYHWAILVDGAFAGAIGGYKIKDGWDIGYWLGEPYWGRGLASEIVSALTDHIQSHAPDAALTACVFIDNPASARVLRKAGFIQAAEPCQGYSLARRAHMDNWTFERAALATRKVEGRAHLESEA
jgi:RimJ/RimL family protein N-acetyltransferase